MGEIVVITTDRMTDYNDPSTFHHHMQAALEEARCALTAREVPVGCTFVCGRTGELLASGRNRMTERCNATSHAELLAASFILSSAPTPEEGRARLRESTLYVTVEPCVMCAAAMLSLGIKRIVFGCFNENFGGCGTVLSVHRGVAECLGSGGLASSSSSSSSSSLSSLVTSSTSSSSSTLSIASTSSSVSSTEITSVSSSVIPLPTRPSPPLEVVGGICEKEAIDLLRAFYRAPNPKAPKNQAKAPKVEKTHEGIRLLNTAPLSNTAATVGVEQQVEPLKKGTDFAEIFEETSTLEEKKIKL